MLAFTHARVIDGTGRPAEGNCTVLISGMTVAGVGINLPIPEEAAVIDLKGKTLMPALSEAHTHFGGSDRLTRPALGGRELTYDYARSSAEFLAWGVTTVRSAGDWMPDIVTFREEVSRGTFCAPRILTAGRMFVAQGGHPLDTVFMSDAGIRKNACIVCDGATEIDEEVKAMVEAGADWIKAFLSTVNKMNYPVPTPRLPHETLQKITDAAHRWGKPVMLHVENPDDIDEALTLGVDSIEHVVGVGNTKFETDDRLIRRLADSRTYVVPTMSAIFAHDGSLPGAERVYPRLEEAVRKMIDAGVRIAVGCDSGIPFLPYGESVHMELELLVNAGMPPIAALAAATGGNANLFGLGGRLGTIQVGQLADILVLDGDPLVDIRNTRRIRLVIKEGRIVTDRMLSE